MVNAFMGPKSMLDNKPPHGAPCTRCGLCCVASLCSLAQHVFAAPARPGPCPALLMNGDESSCGLVVGSVAPDAAPDQHAEQDEHDPDLDVAGQIGSLQAGSGDVGGVEQARR